MKILHVIPYLHPDAGGPPVVVEQLVRSHAAAGHQSYVLTTPLYCDGRDLELKQAWDGLATLEFLPSSRIAAWFDPGSYEKISEYVARSDIVHVHTLWHSINSLVRRACKSHSRPYVIMPHGMLDPYSLSVGKLKKQIFLSLFERPNLLAAQHVIYTTPAERNLAEGGLPWLRGGCIAPLGGDAPGDSDKSLKRDFLEAFPQIANKRVLLYLGRVDFKKGLDRIIAAMPSVLTAEPEALLLIVGNGQASFGEEMRSEIDSRGLKEAVVWAGPLSGRAKWGAFSASEIFLLPSRQENFAITVAEAMHMGRPLIVTDKVNTASDVLQAEAGIVLEETECAATLAPAIVTLLADQERIAAMGARGRAYAAEHLTWAKSAERMLSVYEGVLGGRCE